MQSANAKNESLPHPSEQAYAMDLDSEKISSLQEISSVMTTADATVEHNEAPPTHGNKIILTESDCPQALGYAFPTQKKWKILIVIFLVQCSMNFNTSLYSNGLVGMSEEFGITVQDARTGAAIFLVTYAFGCEL